MNNQNNEHITHKFHIEAIWCNIEQKYVEYKICEVIGDAEHLMNLISDVAIGSPVVAAIITGSFKKLAEESLMRGMRLREAQNENEVITKEIPLKPPEHKKMEIIPQEKKSILQMSDKELKDFIRRKNENR